MGICTFLSDVSFVPQKVLPADQAGLVSTGMEFLSKDAVYTAVQYSDWLFGQEWNDVMLEMAADDFEEKLRSGEVSQEDQQVLEALIVLFRFWAEKNVIFSYG